MSWSSGQVLELLVVLCTVDGFRYGITKIRAASVLAESNSGPVRPDSMPTRLFFLITPVLALIHILFPTIYVFSVMYSRLQQPAWMVALALPDVMFGKMLEGMWKNALRVLACVVSIASQRPAEEAFEHLGDQFHPIGRREKSRLVQTGPYAWVRHPIYSVVLLQEALWTLMFWSYVPLFTVVVSTAIYAVKIPMEEEAILRDEAVREEYREYMKKVPSKLVPHIW